MNAYDYWLIQTQDYFIVIRQKLENRQLEPNYFKIGKIGSAVVRIVLKHHFTIIGIVIIFEQGSNIKINFVQDQVLRTSIVCQSSVLILTPFSTTNYTAQTKINLLAYLS